MAWLGVGGVVARELEVYEKLEPCHSWGVRCRGNKRNRREVPVYVAEVALLGPAAVLDCEGRREG